MIDHAWEYQIRNEKRDAGSRETGDQLFPVSVLDYISGIQQAGKEGKYYKIILNL